MLLSGRKLPHLFVKIENFMLTQFELEKRFYNPRPCFLRASTFLQVIPSWNFTSIRPVDRCYIRAAGQPILYSMDKL